jgi:hypothetical protein
MKAGMLFSAILLALTGCGGTIQQNVKPLSLSGSDTREICLIENLAVGDGFVEAYRSALEQRSLRVRMLPQGSALNACPVTLTYTANWMWDLTKYLAYANLKVYRNGNLEAQAVYDGLKAGLNTAKFIKAEAKIQELTNQLFPG